MTTLNLADKLLSFKHCYFLHLPTVLIVLLQHKFAIQQHQPQMLKTILNFQKQIKTQFAEPKFKYSIQTTTG